MARSLVNTPTITNSSCRPRLALLGGFSLTVAGKNIPLPMHSRRVLAYVSLDIAHSHSCDRGSLAERLWPEVNADRSRASLRTALWRIRQASPDLVEVQPETVRLAATVDVDLKLVREMADRMMQGHSDFSPESQHLLLKSADLLPGWDETWLVLAREQLRQTRLHALEANADRLQRMGKYPEAIETMLAVIADEPLRESAHSRLIDIHLAEGNASEALRQFEVLVEVLWRELRLRPSPKLYEKVGITASPPVTHAAPRSVPARPQAVPGIN